MFNLFINNKKMKKTTVMRAYEAPVVNVESINVEKGFALSIEPGEEIDPFAK